jgi:uncharacterized protein YdcH (DUF465 family)
LAASGSRAQTTPATDTKGDRLMESITTQDDLKAHLMATDDTYRRLAEEHAEFHKQLEAIEAKTHLTTADEAEETRLKKIKLRIKDEMTQILARYKAQKVA